jgi:hypothetical protein
MGIHLVGEGPDDVGIQFGHRQDDICQIAVCHHIFRIGEDRGKLLQPEHMRWALQAPRSRGLAPLQQLHHAPLIGERGLQSAFSTSHAE